MLCDPDQDGKPMRKPLRKLLDLHGSTGAGRTPPTTGAKFIQTSILSRRNTAQWEIEANSVAASGASLQVTSIREIEFTPFIARQVR